MRLARIFFGLIRTPLSDRATGDLATEDNRHDDRSDAVQRRAE
jgi:hypothetical protein